MGIGIVSITNYVKISFFFIYVCMCMMRLTNNTIMIYVFFFLLFLLFLRPKNYEIEGWWWDLSEDNSIFIMGLGWFSCKERKTKWYVCLCSQLLVLLIRWFPSASYLVVALILFRGSHSQFLKTLDFLVLPPNNS